jgi:hypothetical protein
MSGNKSYDKGYRFECKIREDLLKYFDPKFVSRAHRSGAYTGEQDLTFKHDNRMWTIDCKSGDGWEGKRHRARLETADMCIDGPDRKVPLLIMPWPKGLEFAGFKEPKLIGPEAAKAIEVLMGLGYSFPQATEMVASQGEEGGSES